jgi:hypothetical protein
MVAGSVSFAVSIAVSGTVADRFIAESRHTPSG